MVQRPGGLQPEWGRLEFISHDQTRSRAYRWGEDGIAQTNRHRNRYDFEYELLDAGLFNENRYFDVLIEYANQTPEDILVQISVHNRGPEKAVLHLLPTLWFRNTWWQSEDAPHPELKEIPAKENVTAIWQGN